jgi:hypothetical protein
MEELFISKVRVKLLTLFLTTEEPLLHVREIVRRVDEEINAVRRDLNGAQIVDFTAFAKIMSFIRRF